MLLEGKLYNIKSIESTGAKLLAFIEIIPTHPVFDGHFPGNPILPGVCTLHICGELLSKHLKQQYILIKSENIKFTSLVIPTENTILGYEISFSKTDEQHIAVKCTVTGNKVEILKMKGSYLCQ